MVALLLYAYSFGIRSSREIEKLCARDIGFKVIAANQVPDHCTISRFRKDNGTALAELFKQILKLCKETGLVKVGIVVLDGSKVKASAALESNRTYGHIEQEVKKMLDEAEAKDAEEDRQYDPTSGATKFPTILPTRPAAEPALRHARSGWSRRLRKPLQNSSQRSKNAWQKKPRPARRNEAASLRSRTRHHRRKQKPT